MNMSHPVITAFKVCYFKITVEAVLFQPLMWEKFWATLKNRFPSSIEKNLGAYWFVAVIPV